MGRLLKVLGLVFLVLVVLFAGLLFWAQRSGSELQGKFFSAIASGKSEQALALMDPALGNEIDEPVLAAWMAAVNAKLGPCQGLRKSDFHTSSELKDGATLTRSKGTVDFQKGAAQSELVFRDGLLVKFSVESEHLGDKWFQGPASNELYHERGKQLLTLLALGDAAKAHAMMHEALKEAMPLEKLQKLLAALREKTGALRSITWQKDEFENKDGQRLKVFYRAEFEKKPMAGLVQFRFVGLKGHILAFDLSEPLGR